MAGLPAPTFDTATIAGVDCHTPAWTLTNSHLLRDPAPKERSNVKLAGVDGRLGRQSTKDQRTVGLEFYVVGDVDRLGVPHDDPLEGVEANINYLRDNMYEATEDQFGSVVCTVTAADGTVYDGPIQLDDFVSPPGIGARWVFIQATLPDGYLEAVSS
jgi:hypothetical protein